MRHFSVARLFKSMAMACIALTSAPLMAVDFDQSQYDVYIGDRNGDGRDDILLVAKDSIIPIHGEVLVPLAVQLSENYAIESGPGFYYDPVTLSDAEIDLSGFSLATNTVIYDYNNDGQLDLVIGQQGTSLGNIALLGGADSSEDPILVANVDEYDVLSTPPNPGSIGIAENHVNGHILRKSDALVPIAGEFRVSEGGAATYSIPVYAPPGSAGVTPQITLNYSSQSGNGLLGQGWAMGGLSSVTRCRQTMATDGRATPISWSEEDRFCLDGQRLILTSDSEYGAVGATYKTEVDQFAKIVTIGGVLGNPQYFEMHAKDGSISEFGKIADSKFDNTIENMTYTWALSRISDNVGNKIDFSYEKTTTTQKISRIDYGTSDVNHSSIVFKYEARPDNKSSYVAGLRLDTVDRLTNIEVSANNNLLRNYQFTYDHINTDYSRIVKLEECSDIEKSNCRGSTNFDWQYPLTGLSSVREKLFELEDTRLLDFRPIDINGDGYLDLAYLRLTGGLSTHVFSYVLSNGDGFSPDDIVRVVDFPNSVINGDTVKMEVLDYNADGRTDVMIYNSGVEYSQRWSLYLSEPIGNGRWELRKKNITFPFGSEYVTFGDFTSDGLADAAVGLSIFPLVKGPDSEKSTSTYYRFSSTPLPALNGDSLFPEVEIDDGGGAGSFYEEELNERLEPVPGGVADFNGDGRIDFLLKLEQDIEGNFQSQSQDDEYTTHDYTTYYVVAVQDEYGNLNEFPGFKIRVLDQVTDDNEYRSFRSADINGDGNSDLIYLNALSDLRGKWFALISDGTKFGSPIELVDFSTLPGNPERENDRDAKLVDLNNDGYLDFIWHDHTARRLKVKYWQPTENQFDIDESLVPVYDANLTDLDYVYSPDDIEGYRGNTSPSGVLTTTGNIDDSYTFVDVNGSGTVDLIWHDVSASEVKINKNRQRGTTNHVVDKITDGLGAITSIEYASMANTDHYQSIEVDLGSSTREVEMCFDTGFDDEYEEYCYTRTVTTFDSEDYYSALNNPFVGLANVLGTTNTYPVLEMNMGVLLVTNVSSSSPTRTNPNALATISYHYEEAKIQAAGRGFLGFKRLGTLDLQTGIQSATTYRQDFPFIGTPLKTETLYADRLISSAENFWDTKTLDFSGRKVYQPFIQSSIEKGFKVTSSDSLFTVSTDLLKQVDTINVYDDYGNQLYSKVTTAANGETYTLETFNDYGAEIQSKEWGRLRETTAKHTRSDSVGGPVSRTSKFDYYGFGCADVSGMSGLLCSETVNALSDFALTTTYEYDQYGNKINSISNGNGVVENRTSSSTYGSHGRYMDRAVNHYGQINQDVSAWDDYGQPLEVKDVLGVSSQFKYSPMGEQYLQYNQSGIYSVTYRSDPSSDPESECPNAAYQVNTIEPDNSYSYECFDIVGRSILKATRLLNGEMSLVASSYDTLGRMVQQSEPYKAESPAIYWTTYTYDVLGNVVKLDQPNYDNNERIIRTSYSGFDKTEINPLNQSRTETTNPLGELAKVVDHNSTQVEYIYSAIGDLSYTKTTAGSVTHTIAMEFDSYGHKTQLTDPDKGVWKYSYNSFNELTQQTNGNGQKRDLEYDQLGRVIRRLEPDGTTEWVYNNTNVGNSRGKIEYEVLFDSSGNLKYQMDYVYDNFGRVIETITTIDGEEFSQRTTYDEYSRKYQSFDAAETLNTMQYEYKNGHIYTIRDAANDELYYQANGMDSRGNISEYVQGAVTTQRNYDAATGFLVTVNSHVAGVFGTQDLKFTWDALSNLKSRIEQSGSKDLTESFNYDSLNRLSSSQVEGEDLQSYSYDAFGNMTFKTGVGDYKYGNACTNGAGPHAVCEINNGSTTETFNYDNNGNMVTHFINGAADRQFLYSSFDKPTRIIKGDHTTEFEYGTGRSRYKRIDDANGETTTTLYVGSVEILTKPDGNREVRRYINGTVLVTQDYNRDVNGEYQFARAVTRNILTDHLGSTDVITDSNGQIVQEQSFDAWGSRRSILDGIRLDDLELTLLSTDINNEFTTKGFTGHESVDQVGIIHMNGRIYDPRLSRFLQADPNIDGVDTTQGYNRYSYVHNNPLNATDPTGFFFDKIFGELNELFGDAAPFLSIALFAIAPGIAAWATQSIGHAFAFGFVTGGIASGNLRGAFIGGISGAAFRAIGGQFTAKQGFFKTGGAGHIAAHAATGGVLEELKGGKFGHGFVSAGIVKFTAPYVSGIDAIEVGGTSIAEAVTAAAIGGTVSEITGGKFANGATTAFFQNVFNAQANDERSENDDDRGWFFQLKVKFLNKGFVRVDDNLDLDLGYDHGFAEVTTDAEVSLKDDHSKVGDTNETCKFVICLGSKGEGIWLGVRIKWKIFELKIGGKDPLDANNGILGPDLNGSRREQIIDEASRGR
ncbi:RHS repeat-associated core domain-containing protein [Sessilibacter corallicola]|uniref:RHS repeat-associated core domain-containing protein n=1 Tax=Sessilibacter corallicola TaxID=2904075 RepID=UPI001E5D8C3A|nr:RHS repeat-associated core domain-containing protein [Sessilibacter corallicola]MCE2026862.1 hypothetical protein [Sessilibacter corallicola]